MRTDDLIQALASKLEPSSPRTPIWRLAAWVFTAALLSAVLMLAGLGLRPDILAALTTMMFWTKFFYTLALGGFALWAVERLGRPGVQVALPIIALMLVTVCFVSIALGQLALAPPGLRHALLMGHSAHLCPFVILALSLPLLVATVFGLRDFAPTRPMLAGFAAGTAAGGLAAFVYAFSCNESAMPFVAVWYTLPVLLAAAAGALIGRFALRW